MDYRIRDGLNLRVFLMELGLYVVLTIVYLMIVIKFLSNFLYGLSLGNTVLYAIVALSLMILQGYILEYITSFIMDNLEKQD